jgi:hypothetical protein
MLSRTPEAYGRVPVIIVVCDGSVSGTCAYAFSNTTPSAVSRSIAGVSTFFAPYARR